MEVAVVGGGLAGTEAAFQLARRGIRVKLFEMRPVASTPAHKTAYLAELVCSNSLKSQELANAHGLLKEELRLLGSLLISIADTTAIPGGKALVVNRERFARAVTEAVSANPFIEIIRGEVRDIPGGVVIIASGPLTSDALARRIAEVTGNENLSFYDAISPIVDAGSIDMSRAFFGSRYSAGNDYLNCPLTAAEYDAFYDGLVTGQRVPLRDFEEIPFFEGCLPVEVMAERGKETLLFGPMKPVGIIDPSTGKRPFGVIQLRREDEAGNMYNMVGFQTRLTYPEQDRVFRLVPALTDTLFLRYGSIHRNTYINTPRLLDRRLMLRDSERIFFAGQLTGVEGYVESIATGLMAGVSAAAFLKGSPFEAPTGETAVGGLLDYITEERKNFQPMNVNFGLLRGYSKREKKAAIERALVAMARWSKTTGGTDRLADPVTP